MPRLNPSSYPYPITRTGSEPLQRTPSKLAHLRMVLHHKHMILVF
jgi:hypothetical protein